jgi:hypothetical protein
MDTEIKTDKNKREDLRDCTDKKEKMVGIAHPTGERDGGVIILKSTLPFAKAGREEGALKRNHEEVVSSE